VVNLVGIQTESWRQTFEAVHVAGARAIAKAARESGVKSLVHVSAIGANPTSTSAYFRTKAAAEREILGEFPNCVILRPAVVFGPEDRLFNRLAAMTRLLPFLPLVGRGKTKFQPLYVGDVAAAIATACAERANLDSIYELGGPEVITLRGLLSQTLQWTGRRRLLLPIPFWSAKLAALMTMPLPNNIRPFTYDQICRLETDNVVSKSAEASGRTLAGLGIGGPHTAELFVPPYLEQFHPRGQFAHYHTLDDHM
jgi:NADH dehydrogenase